jgi:hypothetical protein
MIGRGDPVVCAMNYRGAGDGIKVVPELNNITPEKSVVSTGIAPLIIDLCSFTPSPLFRQRKIPPYPFCMMFGAAAESVWMFWRRKISLVPSWNRIPILRMCSS